ncbi:MAG: hypothetical protein ABIK38_05525 [candidate division WOR-3 bacterium]
MNYRNLIVLSVLSVLMSGCHNRPPSVPIIFGPQRGRPNDTLVFSVISVDREGDSVAYLFEWNNQSSSGWTEWFPQGVEIVRQFSFADTGSFFLRAKARDRQHESGWSESLNVTVRWYVPSVPKKPAGPDTVIVGDNVTFYSSALHPLNELVAIQFCWGDTVDVWSDYVLPGTIVAKSHVFTMEGEFEVRCRAKDKKGYLSDWSAPETVFVQTGQTR